MKKIWKHNIFISVAAILSACGGGGGESSPTPVSNKAPVANAGQMQNILVGANVTLNGSASSDEDKDSLTYFWTLTSRPSGSLAELIGANTATPTLIADVAGTYLASLIVSDGKEFSTAATATINAVVSDNGQKSTDLPFEGVWQGLADSYNETPYLIALNNKEIYIIHAQMQNGGAYTTYSFSKGAGNFDNNILTANLDFYFSGVYPSSASLKADLIPFKSIHGSINYSMGVQQNLVMTPISKTLFDYNRAAQIGDVQGSWSGSVVNGFNGAVILTVESNGSIRGSLGGCSFSGLMEPLNSGENLFNVSLKNNVGRECILYGISGMDFEGIAMNYSIEKKNKSQIIFTVQNKNSKRGYMFIADR